MTVPTTTPVRRSPDVGMLLESVDGFSFLVESRSIGDPVVLGRIGADRLIAGTPVEGAFARLAQARNRALEARTDLTEACDPMRRNRAQNADADALTAAAAEPEFVDPGRPAEAAVRAEIEAAYRRLTAFVGNFRQVLSETQGLIATLRPDFADTLAKQLSAANTKARKALTQLAEAASVIEATSTLAEWLPTLGRTGFIALPTVDHALSNAVADVAALVGEAP